MTSDLVTENGYLFLGTRLRRLGEQLQLDANQASQRAGIVVPVGKLPLLAQLADTGPQTVSDLARALGQSQPVTTRSVEKLVALDLVRLDRTDADGRQRIVSLTPAGEQTIAKSRSLVWPHVEAAVRQIAGGLSGSLLEQLAALEQALAERPLADRAADLAADALIPATDDDVPAIVDLMNRAYRGSRAASAWTTEADYIGGNRITEALLRADIAEKPHARLLTWRDPSGQPLKGSVWVEPLGDGRWYLGSLAVDPGLQNSGLGHALLSAAEQWIRQRGGDRIRITVVNVRDTLIAWYRRRDYVPTGETAPFPYGDNRFGTPLRDDLAFTVLEKDLRQSPLDSAGAAR